MQSSRGTTGAFVAEVCDMTDIRAVMPVLTSGQTRSDDAIIRAEMRSAQSLATTLDEISMLIYDGLQFGNAKLWTVAQSPLPSSTILPPFPRAPRHDLTTTDFGTGRPDGNCRRLCRPYVVVTWWTVRDFSRRGSDFRSRCSVVRSASDWRLLVQKFRNISPRHSMDSDWNGRICVSRFFAFSWYMFPFLSFHFLLRFSLSLTLFYLCMYSFVMKNI